MKRTVPLRSRTPMVRTPMPRTRAKRRPKLRDTGPSAKVRGLVLRRDAARCLRCGVPGGWQPLVPHHRRPRGAGGTSDERINGVANLVTLCADCHLGHVEKHRNAARDDGWLLRDVADATTTPIWTWRGWVYLTDEGTYRGDTP